MKIEVPDKTAEEVQAMLARQGEDPDVEAFVQRTLAKRLLFEAVSQVREGNDDVEAEEIQDVVDEAVSEVRAANKRQSPNVGRGINSFSSRRPPMQQIGNNSDLRSDEDVTRKP